MKHSNSIIALTLTLVLGLGPVLTFAGERPSRSLSLHNRAAMATRRARRVARARAQMPDPVAGQTVTPLPDDRVLLIGGVGPDGPTKSLVVSNLRTGKSKSLPDMQVGRAWHTATMLPDGRVFIFGGVGANKRASNGAAILDPASGEIEELPAQIKLTPRSNHTATLLTDGQVLICGGVSAKDTVANEAQLWNYKTKTVAPIATLSIARQKHQAQLLADGNVLITGGVDNNNVQVSANELFNPETKSFSVTSITSDPDDSQLPYLSASLPSDRATAVAIDATVALRFSKRLPASANIKAAVKLETGAEGVATKIVAAEDGRLAFITPLEPLRKGITYTVTLTGTPDGSVSVSPTAFSFTTVADRNTGFDGMPADTDWVPGPDNLRGNWRIKAERSKWQDEPPLLAGAGETALSGQVLTLKGAPLPNVTISIQDQSSRTDSAGRFLLRTSTTGRQVMLIDGRTGSRPGTTYGIFRAGVDVIANQTTVLPYTIWMPKLDMAHAVNIPSPTRRDTVITTPLIPGLELHLPAGTVIRDLDGKAVTQLSITPVPTDRPPFPLPQGLTVPVFASIQPGGAILIPPRAQLIYPNYTNARPGTRIKFWNYDPGDKGWYVYGQGTVTPDGKQIVPDAGVVIYEFSGIMIGDSGNPPGDSPRRDGMGGDPVDLSTGLFLLEKTDLVVPDTIPIVMKRTYRPGDSTSRAFGIGSTHPYELFLWSQNNYQEVDLILPDGRSIHYDRISAGTGFTDAVYEHVQTPTEFYKSQIYWNGNGAWECRLTNGTVFVLPEFAPLQEVRDRYGNKLIITRTPNQMGKISQITSSNGRWVQFTYDGSSRITQLKDNSGRTVGYTYDGSGRLWKVTDANGEITEYTYDTSHRMLTVKDARGITYLTNEYDTNGRVIEQTQADSTTYEFDYTLNGSGEVTQTDVTDPRGNVRRVTFNSDGYMLTDTRALGTAVEQTFTYERESGSNLVLSVTDPLDHETTYTHDSNGNVTSITRLEGTADEVTTSYTYDPNYNRPLTITDPLSHTTTLAYDLYGNRTSVTDALSHQTTFTYNSSGQVLTATDPLSHAFTFTYDAGDLVSVTDPLTRTSTRQFDSVGRLVSATDPLGRSTRYAYDGLNQITSSTDPRGGVTSFSYDENGNVLSVTDARSNVTNFEYDNMDRLITRTDPLTHDDVYDYDENGNLIEITDREGQVTAYEYDALNRLTEVTYDDSSTTTYTYDLANRLTEVDDSVSGTITLEYDDLNRLTEETTPEGTVTYTYDDAGRRSSMTVTGQSAVNYTYDNANRLTQITKSTATVTIAYDNANRRSTLTLPNGVSAEYTFDAASQLTALTYKYGGSTIGDLSYTFDAARRRTAIGGSYARTGLPSAVGSATYNAANEQTAFGSLTLSYDLNGNLTGDGTNTYAWNARKQLSSISGGVSASFTYDGLGRRNSKTVSSTTTSYLHDRLNVVQELSGSTPTANMITGGLDEIFTRTDSSSTVSFLADGIGSILGLTNSSGSVQTEYTYEPFGKSSTSGTANGNTSQFTARENDGTDLYYYRSRYYSPTLQRFLSQDPLGFGSGDTNLYAYVRNSPLNLVDPLGLDGEEGGPHAGAPSGWLDAFLEWLWPTMHSAIPGGEFAEAAHIAPQLADTLVKVGDKNDEVNRDIACATGGPCLPTEKELKEERERREREGQPPTPEGPPGEPGDPNAPGQPGPYDPSGPGMPPYGDPNAPGLPPGAPPTGGRKDNS